MSQPIFKPGDRVIATVTIDCRIPCHPSHDESGERVIWTVATGTRGTVADALPGRRDATGDAVGYVAVRFDAVTWHDPDPEYSSLRYLCVAEHQLHIIPVSGCTHTNARGFAVGEPPAFESQVCRTTGEPRYCCSCHRCERAYRRRANQLAEMDAHLLHTMQSFEAGAVPDHPQTLDTVLAADSGRYRCGGKGVG